MSEGDGSRVRGGWRGAAGQGGAFQHCGQEDPLGWTLGAEPWGRERGSGASIRGRAFLALLVQGRWPLVSGWQWGGLCGQSRGRRVGGGVREAPGGCHVATPDLLHLSLAPPESCMPPLGTLPSAGDEGCPSLVSKGPPPSEPAMLTHLHVLWGEAPERLQREVRLVSLLPLHVLVVVGGALALQPQVADELLHLPESKARTQSGCQEGGLWGAESAPPAVLLIP